MRDEEGGRCFRVGVRQVAGRTVGEQLGSWDPALVPDPNPIARQPAACLDLCHLNWIL